MCNILCILTLINILDMKTKNLTNEQALRKGLKEVENMGTLASGVLRERLLTLCQMNLIQVKENPNLYTNFFFTADSYKNVLTTFINAIDFQDNTDLIDDNHPDNIDKDFKKWLESDNVVYMGNNKYYEQTTQWKCLFTYEELKAYYIKEFTNL